LSRDPAGFVDGPNLYAYVKQNPWSQFDAHGLFVSAILEKLDEHVFTPVGEAVGKGIASVMPAETLVNVTQNSQAFAATGQALNGAKSASMTALNTLSPFDDATKAALNGDIKGALVEGGKEVAGGKFAKAGSKLLKAGGEMMAGLAKKSDNMVTSAQKTAGDAAALAGDATKTGVDGKPIKSWESNTSPSLQKKGQKHIETNESTADFQKKLEDRGFSSSQTSSGATQLTNPKTGVAYTVKPQSRTGPPTAYRNDGTGQTHKIRLEKDR